MFVWKAISLISPVTAEIRSTLFWIVSIPIFRFACSAISFREAVSMCCEGVNADAPARQHARVVQAPQALKHRQAVLTPRS